MRFFVERKLAERLDRIGILGVAVGIIGRKNDIVVTEPVDILTDRFFVDFHRDEALVSKVLRRLSGEITSLIPTHPLVVLVESMQ